MLDKLHLIYLPLFILNFPSPVHDGSLFSLYFVIEQITCASKHPGHNGITCTGQFSWAGEGCPVSPLAFCHKVPSSPGEGGGEVSLSNWAPEFTQEKKQRVCSFGFSLTQLWPLLQIIFLFKTSCKWNNVWKNCSSTLWMGGFAAELSLQAMRNSIMQSSFPLLYEYRDNFQHCILGRNYGSQ